MHQGAFFAQPLRTRCTAKVNSQGCAPQILFSASPSASSAAPFSIGATQVIHQKSACSGTRWLRTTCCSKAACCASAHLDAARRCRCPAAIRARRTALGPTPSISALASNPASTRSSSPAPRCSRSTGNEIRWLLSVSGSRPPSRFTLHPEGLPAARRSAERRNFAAGRHRRLRRDHEPRFVATQTNHAAAQAVGSGARHGGRETSRRAKARPPTASRRAARASRDYSAKSKLVGPFGNVAQGPNSVTGTSGVTTSS